MMSPGTAVPPDPRAYVRIAGVLREMISSRVLPPGSPAPSITRLCREYGHARQTCERAMRLLEDEGLLHRVPGLGYYVTGGNAGITPNGTFAAGPGLRALGPDAGTASADRRNPGTPRDPRLECNPPHGRRDARCVPSSPEQPPLARLASQASRPGLQFPGPE
jgi:DNA-binding transcriptional MocR family regulator